MGTNTLNDRSSGETITSDFFNNIHTAMNSDFVGRNASGVATSGQSLGSNSLPWGSSYITSLILNGSAVDTSLLTAPKNRIVSGKKRSTSNQPQFIVPNGAAASFILEGATTNLVLDIDGTAVTVTTDITKSSLTVGPSTTPTCLVDDADAADQESTKTWGEYQSEKETITVDTMGAEMQTFIGQFQVVKIVGVATEYALVFIKSATELTNAYRGFFTDSSSAPVNRTGFTNNDVITVLSTGWVFVENDSTTVDVTYTTPIRSFTSPTGPATGDYWYDMANETWKRYDGASWQVINRTLVGVVGIDSANCVCARSFDFFAKYSDQNSSQFEIDTTAIIKISNANASINVYGVDLSFGTNKENWNITTDLATAADMYNATEQSSTLYYAYLADTGEAIISDISPHYRPDLLGHYHPHNPWRCLAFFYNDGSGNITLIDEMLFNKNIVKKWMRASDQQTSGTNAGGSSANTVQIRVLNTLEGDASFSSISSNQVTILPGDYLFEGGGIGHQIDQHQSFLHDGTNYIVEGESSYCGAAIPLNDVAGISEIVRISVPTTLELRHWTASAAGSTGLGRASNGTNNPQSNEMYSQLRMTKFNKGL